MAEFVVLFDPHWISKLSSTELFSLPTKIRTIANTVFIPGDLITVHEDGSCKERPAIGSRMIIVKIPGMPLKEGRAFCKPYYMKAEVITPIKIRKRRFNIDLSKIILKEGMVTLTIEKFRTIVRDKTLG